MRVCDIFVHHCFNFQSVKYNNRGPSHCCTFSHFLRNYTMLDAMDSQFSFRRIWKVENSKWKDSQSRAPSILTRRRWNRAWVKDSIIRFKFNFAWFFEILKKVTKILKRFCKCYQFLKIWDICLKFVGFQEDLLKQLSQTQIWSVRSEKKKQ